MQWLNYSKKEYCELCAHRFKFTPIYSPDMPRRLPFRVLVTGVLSSVLQGLRLWLHYALVLLAWLGIVPLTACRIYRCLFTGSVSSLLTLPLDMLSTDNLLVDCGCGLCVVALTLVAFIGYIWLRDQLLHGQVGLDWLEVDGPQVDAANGPEAPAEPLPQGGPEGGGGAVVPVQPAPNAPAPRIRLPGFLGIGVGAAGAAGAGAGLPGGLLPGNNNPLGKSSSFGGALVGRSLRTLPPQATTTEWEEAVEAAAEMTAERWRRPLPTGTVLLASPRS